MNAKQFHLLQIARVAAMVLVLGSGAYATVSFDWLPVGNVGNAPDTKVMTKGGAPDLTTGYGSVGYEFNIAKNSVTNAQYVEFLNAVDPAGTNTRNLYIPRMSTNPLGLAYTGGIDFNAAATNGSKYSVKPGQNNRPATWINWFSSARLVNWMSNGQGSGNTEDGVYDLTLAHPIRKPGATIFIPSENEYYKAAYYDPTKGGTGGYWEYASKSDAIATSEAPPGGTNSMNVRRSDGTYWQTNASFNANVDYLVDVGSYANTSSYYGALDMDANIYSWTEAFRPGIVNPAQEFPVYRGGSWYYDTGSSGASHRNIYSFANTTSYAWFGIRLAGLPSVAVNHVWNVDANGNWSGPANWTNGVPSGADSVAKLGTAITSPRTITLDQPQTLGTLTIDHSISYSISGSSVLILNATTGAAKIEVLSGQHTITAPIALAAHTDISIASGSRLDLLTTVNGAARRLTKTGEGVLVATLLNIDTLDVQQGRLDYAGSYLGPWRMNHVSIAPGAAINLDAGGDVLVDYTSASPLDSIRTLISDGRLMTLEANTVLGFGEVSVLPSGTVSGADSTAVFVRATLLGDVNLDRIVGFDDLLRLAQHYSVASGATWTDGDFNHDQAVNFDDLLGLAQNYGAASQLILPDDVSSQFTADWALARSLVPEPTSAIALLAGTLLSGRRRQHPFNFQTIRRTQPAGRSPKPVIGLSHLLEGEMQ